MSSMLEQAIVDAKSLREAAIRNAEETLVEKYSDDIKEAVEKLLEQEELPPEEMMGMLPPEGAPMPPGPMDMGGEAPPLGLEEVPLGATLEEPLCGCPEEGEQTLLTINFNDLEQALNAEEGGDGLGAGPHPMPDEIIPDASLAEEIDISEMELRDLVEQVASGDLDLDDLGGDFDAPSTQELAANVESDLEDLDLDEEVLDLTEEELANLLEKVVVDMAPVSNGWAGRPLAEREFEEEKHKAVLAQEHEIDVLTQENRRLEGYALQLQESIEIFKQREHRYNEVVTSLKEKFNEMSLSNARLLYTNKVLNSASLNERQKSRVVDAISNVSSVEEAKVIFETLQNAVGSSPVKRRGPKSLSETVERRSSSLLAGRRNKQPKSDVPDSAKSRMQRLAGIK